MGYADRIKSEQELARIKEIFDKESATLAAELRAIEDARKQKIITPDEYAAQMAVFDKKEDDFWNRRAAAGLTKPEGMPEHDIGSAH